MGMVLLVVTAEALTTPAAKAPVHPDVSGLMGGRLLAVPPLSAKPHNPTMPEAASFPPSSAPCGTLWDLGEAGGSQEEGALWTHFCTPLRMLVASLGSGMAWELLSGPLLLIAPRKKILRHSYPLKTGVFL